MFAMKNRKKQKARARDCVRKVYGEEMLKLWRQNGWGSKHGYWHNPHEWVTRG